MSTVYTPTAVKLGDITLPTGADARTATSITAPLEAVADGVAFLGGRTDLLEALNFPTKVDWSGVLTCATWCETQRLWWFAGEDADVVSSKHSGVASTTIYVVAGAGGTEDAANVAVDTSGNAVIGLSNSNSIFEYDISTDTWTEVALGAIASDGRVAYDPGAARWCVITNGSTAAGVRTSTNRTTWANGTVPTEWGDHTTYPALERYRIASDGTSRIVVVGQGWAGPGPTGVGICRAMTSDDGGVTWTDRGTFATTISGPAAGSLTYDTTGAQWVYTIGEVTGADSCEVWTSPTGVTWTKVSTITTGCLVKIACLDGLYLGLFGGASAAASVICSSDLVTWRHANHAISGNGAGIYVGGGQVMAISHNAIWPGLRVGNPGAVIT